MKRKFFMPVNNNVINQISNHHYKKEINKDSDSETRIENDIKEKAEINNNEQINNFKLSLPGTN
jgi:hypothetical protein